MGKSLLEAIQKVANYDKGEGLEEAVLAFDKKGNLVGRYKDLATAKKLKPGHRYETHDKNKEYGVDTERQLAAMGEGLTEAIIAFDKKGNVAGVYKDLESAKKAKPGHRYEKHDKNKEYGVDTERQLAALGESIDQSDVKEEVEIRHNRYMRSHGKKATGGDGKWMFTHKNFGDVNYDDEKEVHSFTGKFSDASKSAKEWAKKHGHSAVYVMEDVEQIDEISTEKLRDYSSAALHDKQKDKLDKRWKYASKALKTIGDREAKAANELKYGWKSEEVEQIDELSDDLMENKNLTLKKVSNVNTLRKIKNLAIVCFGAGGNHMEWVNGIEEEWKDEGIFISGSNAFSEAYMTTHRGANALVLVIDKNSKFNIGKMAIWRLKFGDCMWLSDFLDNFHPLEDE